jgi:hypothetical protein
MSYCRWSSDNWRCPLYCYESDSGYVTHVAANKVVGDIPEEPSIALLRDGAFAEYAAKHKVVMDFLSTAKRAPLCLPHDGVTFTDPDLPSFLATVIMLRDAGYAVPEWLISDIRDEIAETGA